MELGSSIMIPYLVIGLAGVLGALSRYGVGYFFTAVHGYPSMFATLPINLLGSMTLGWFTTYGTVVKPRLHPLWKLGFGTGFLGAFTTFSTFSVESLSMLQKHDYGNAIIYVMVSLWGGLLAAWLGHQIAALQGQKRTAENRRDADA